jgi:predicted metal-binding protein
MIRLVAVVQCHLVHERCPGYLCDWAFTNRTGGFSGLDLADGARKVSFTCGGCCGRALHRKLSLLKKHAQKYDGIGPDEVLVKLATCISAENYHGPACPHLDYLLDLVRKAGLTPSLDTYISEKAREKRAAGIYKTQERCR